MFQFLQIKDMSSVVAFEGFDLGHVEDGGLFGQAGWHKGFHLDNDTAEGAGGSSSAASFALSHWDASSQPWNLESTGADPSQATALPELQTAGRQRCLEAEMQRRCLEELEQVPCLKQCNRCPPSRPKSTGNCCLVKHLGHRFVTRAMVVPQHSLICIALTIFWGMSLWII